MELRSEAENLKRLIILMILLLSACHGSDRSSSDQKVVAEVSKNTSHLYYEGQVVPIDVHPVVSEVDGVVNRMLVEYGETVKEHQLLLTLNSTQLASEFRQAFSNFFQKKTNYQSTEENFKAAKALHEVGAISREEFIAARNNNESSHLEYFQAKQQLEKILLLTDLDKSSVEGMDLKNLDSIRALYAQDFKDLKIYSPEAGVVLMPQSSSSNHSETQQALMKGSVVKLGQVLLQVTDLNRLGVYLEVHESDINQIQIGASALISGPGFPGIELKGQVVEISPQAQGVGAEISKRGLFKVLVLIPEISSVELEHIHVGMTAKVELIIHHVPLIRLPLGAVKVEGGETMVDVQDPKTHEVHSVKVVTGETSADEISILKGLKGGEEVLVHE